MLVLAFSIASKPDVYTDLLVFEASHVLAFLSGRPSLDSPQRRQYVPKFGNILPTCGTSQSQG
jgi:hypothetical protein